MASAGSDVQKVVRIGSVAYGYRGAPPWLPRFLVTQKLSLFAQPSPFERRVPLHLRAPRGNLDSGVQ